MEIGDTYDMEIDIVHTLEDFIDSYDNTAIMVVAEAIANAMDASSTEINIKLKKDLDENRIISFHNNGKPMTKIEFKNYHVIARSSKSKGKGIGFAGIGAKIYLGAWKKSIIYTETSNGKTALGSKIFIKNNTIKIEYIESKLKKIGTRYTVFLNADDYSYLYKKLNSVIIDIFNSAINNGLKIILNGKNISPWCPSHVFKKSTTLIINNKKFQVKLLITKDDIPKNRQHIQYNVLGKMITVKKLDGELDIKPEYQNKIHIDVNANEISEHLNLNKNNFKPRNGQFNTLNKEINMKMFRILKKKGCIIHHEPEKWETNHFTKFLEKLFKDPKYAFLNPNSKDGKGLGSGIGTGGSGKSSKKNQGKNNRNQTGGGGFAIGFVHYEIDKRDGWLDPMNNKVVINLEHPIYIKYKQNVPARNQRVASVIVSVLIKNASERKSMTTPHAFNLHTELMTLAKDASW